MKKIIGSSKIYSINNMRLEVDILVLEKIKFYKQIEYYNKR